MAPLVQLMVGTVLPLPTILDAFRSGAGVPFGEFGADMREGQAGLNRATFLQVLSQQWLPAIPSVVSACCPSTTTSTRFIGSFHDREELRMNDHVHHHHHHFAGAAFGRRRAILGSAAALAGAA